MGEHQANEFATGLVLGALCCLMIAMFSLLMLFVGLKGGEKGLEIALFLLLFGVCGVGPWVMTFWTVG